VADRVCEVAAARGVLPIQVALAWVVSQPGITAPIIGASKLEQLDQLIAGLEIRLSDQEAKALEGPYQPHRVLGH
jgi:aryl-alcohol dehydrogenase (NADP+)